MGTHHELLSHAVDGRASARELRPVFGRSFALALLCTIAACGSPLDDGDSSSSSTGSSGGAEASSSGGEAGASSTGVSTGAEETSGGATGSTGEASTSSSGTTGELDSSSGGDTTTGDESSSSSSTGGVEHWAHEGVVHNVVVADLVGWEICWSDSYGAGTKVASVTAACKGDHLMMACRPTGGDTLTVAAHAPREDVLFPVDYGAGERHEANGVAWYWSPTSNIEGFAPAGNVEFCDGNIDGVQSDFLCWINADDEPLTFQTGRRCSFNVVNAKEAQSWERVMLQAWN